MNRNDITRLRNLSSAMAEEGLEALKQSAHLSKMGMKYVEILQKAVQSELSPEDVVSNNTKIVGILADTETKSIRKFQLYIKNCHLTIYKKH